MTSGLWHGGRKKFHGCQPTANSKQATNNMHASSIIVALALLAPGGAVETATERLRSTRRLEDECVAYQGDEASAKCSDVGPDGPLVVGGAELPPQLQGVFWLTGQAASSILASFGRNDDADACGFNPGVATPGDGEKNRVIVFGDRNWAFQDPSYSTYELVDHSDLVYEFDFDEDFAHATIQPSFHSAGPPLSTASLLTALSALLSWDADFGDGVDAPQDVVKFEMTLASNPSYPNSVVWTRNTYALGIEIESSRYDLVQILDKDGTKIEPAYGAMLESCDANGVAGELFYHTKKQDETTDAGCTCKEEWSYGWSTYDGCDPASNNGNGPWCVVEGDDCGTAFPWWSVGSGNWDYC